ncbi:hypothetical protein [Sphingobium herbicidovorans]
MFRTRGQSQHLSARIQNKRRHANGFERTGEKSRLLALHSFLQSDATPSRHSRLSENTPLGGSGSPFLSLSQGSQADQANAIKDEIRLAPERDIDFLAEFNVPRRTERSHHAIIVPLIQERVELPAFNMAN